MGGIGTQGQAVDKISPLVRVYESGNVTGRGRRHRGSEYGEGRK
jgi:hypothetical protein